MNSSHALINVITKPTGGGAEFLVRGLHEYLLKCGEHSYLVFLDDDKQAVARRRNSFSIRYLLHKKCISFTKLCERDDIAT
jgi:hypothetical protein